MERLQVALPYELAVNGLNFRLNLGGLHSPRRRAVAPKAIGDQTVRDTTASLE